MTKTIRNCFTAAALVAFAALAGCAQHSDFPSMLPLVKPPTPTNMMITDNGNGTYDITWDISDPAVVDHYNVYSVTIFGTALEGTTPDEMVTVDLQAQLGGVVLGVAAVTVENVEGAMATVVTPDP